MCGLCGASRITLRSPPRVKTESRFQKRFGFERIGERLTILREERFRRWTIAMDYYLWLKSLHVIAIIAWMAGLLYLPRLFVYHADVAAGSDQASTFEIMERRLLRGIMNPAMIVVWVTGPVLAFWGEWYKVGWLHAKIALVIGLTGAHMYFSRRRRLLAERRD